AVSAPTSGAAPSRAAGASVVGEAQLVVAHLEDVALFDALRADLLAEVVDAVGAAEVLDVVGAAVEDDGRVAARDVAVLDGEVGRLGAAADDELFLGDRELLAVEDDEEGGGGRGRGGLRRGRRGQGPGGDGGRGDGGARV